MNRQYVHMSVDMATAVSVGKRHNPDPVILSINTGKAILQGQAFYKGNDMVWLADAVPADCIDIVGRGK